MQRLIVLVPDEKRILLVQQIASVKPMHEPISNTHRLMYRYRNVPLLERVECEWYLIVLVLLDMLPEDFANRSLLIFGKTNNKTIDIIVEDKETEQTIAEIEYSLQFDELGSHTLHKAAINKILSRE